MSTKHWIMGFGIVGILAVMAGAIPSEAADLTRKPYFEKVAYDMEIFGDREMANRLRQLGSEISTVPPALSQNAVAANPAYAEKYITMRARTHRAISLREHPMGQQWRVDRTEANLHVVANELEKGRSANTALMQKYLQDASWALDHTIVATGVKPEFVAASCAPATALMGPAGPAGPQGPRGPQGSRGAQGLAGVGLQGPAGPVGLAGQAGERGFTGSRGPAGLVVAGPPGPIGAMGPVGAAGEVGATGEQGVSLVGLAGPRGPAGPAGSRGVTGFTGETGTTLVGPRGPAGAQGVAGQAGDIGPSGYKGTATVGPSGPAGPSGVSGPQGPTGYIGVEGPVGMVDCWTPYRIFVFNESAQLSSYDRATIAEIAEYARQNPTINLGIDNMAAGSGDARMERVHAVRNALIQAGVSPSRIEIGEFSDPSMRRNSRVEVLIITAQ